MLAQPSICSIPGNSGGSLDLNQGRTTPKEDRTTPKEDRTTPKEDRTTSWETQRTTPLIRRTSRKPIYFLHVLHIIVKVSIGRILSRHSTINNFFTIFNNTKKLFYANNLEILLINYGQKILKKKVDCYKFWNPDLVILYPYA